MERNLLDSTEITAMLMALDSWKQDGGAITRTFKFKDFGAAFSFMSSVADKAVDLDHHPDWSNSGSTVKVRLTTHSAGGLTALDFALAAFMDEAASW
jgi:4a-hydroxytetrahydrobiopterin dehydratase